MAEFKCNNGKLKHAPPDHNDIPTRQEGQKLPEIGAILTPMPAPRGSPWTPLL